MSGCGWDAASGPGSQAKTKMHGPGSPLTNHPPWSRVTTTCSTSSIRVRSLISTWYRMSCPSMHRRGSKPQRGHYHQHLVGPPVANWWILSILSCLCWVLFRCLVITSNYWLVSIRPTLMQWRSRMSLRCTAFRTRHGAGTTRSLGPRFNQAILVQPAILSPRVCLLPFLTSNPGELAMHGVAWRGVARRGMA